MFSIFSYRNKTNKQSIYKKYTLFIEKEEKVQQAISHLHLSQMVTVKNKGI